MSDFVDPNILVAFKKSRWEHHTEGGSDPSVELEREPDSLESLKESHRIHRSGLERVVEHLEAEGVDPTVSYRGEVDDTTPYDLIVTVGGDGTVLDLSHKVRDVPILAVNSHPSSSVGYFCAGTADSFPTLLESTLEETLAAFDLLRYRLRVEGTPTGPPILNDVLFSHRNPAAVSQYVLETSAGDPEKQHSSGIWISTPAGSTAAVRSAGGFVLPLGCNCIEYVVREPYSQPGAPLRHTKGIQPVSETLRLRSRMQDGRVFVDGPHITRELGFRDVIAIDPDAPELTMYGLDVERRTADG